MRELLLSNSSRFAVVDDEDYDRLSMFRWKVSDRSNNIQRSYRKGDQIVMISLAAEIMSQPKQMFDHINRNPFDNQKSNLRACTYSQNGANNSKWNDGANKSSQFKGVWFNKQARKFQAAIRVNYKSKHLGLFADEAEAAKAYNDAAVKHFGEFACINQI